MPVSPTAAKVLGVETELVKTTAGLKARAVVAPEEEFKAGVRRTIPYTLEKHSSQKPKKITGSLVTLSEAMEEPGLTPYGRKGIRVAERKITVGNMVNPATSRKMSRVARRKILGFSLPGRYYLGHKLPENSLGVTL